MTEQQIDPNSIYVDKARAELSDLTQQGVLMAGNAFSSIAFVKGDLSDAEKNGEPLLSGADGKALRAALGALGYPPEDWVGFASIDETGHDLSPELVRCCVLTLDPATLVSCDESAARLIREAFADDLVQVEDFDEAMLAPGKLVYIRGMRVLNLGGFAASLSDPKQKQLMWSYLKEIPVLGQPY